MYRMFALVLFLLTGDVVACDEDKVEVSPFIEDVYVDETQEHCTDVHILFRAVHGSFRLGYVHLHINKNGKDEALSTELQVTHEDDYSFTSVCASKRFLEDAMIEVSPRFPKSVKYRSDGYGFEVSQTVSMCSKAVKTSLAKLIQRFGREK